MASIETHIYIEHNGTEYECAVTVEGNVSHGGSNSYGSDEPAWTEVDDVTVYNSRGKRVSKRLLDKIDAKQWDHMTDLLVEDDASW